MAEELKIGKFKIVSEDLVYDEENDVHVWKQDQVEVAPDDALHIDDTDVDKELRRMGHLLGYYGDLAAKSKAQLARKEEDLEAFEAAADKWLRGNWNEEANGRMTENKVRNLIIDSEDHRRLTALLGVFRTYHYRMDNLFRALHKKADCLMTLSHNQRVERRNF